MKLIMKIFTVVIAMSFTLLVFAADPININKAGVKSMAKNLDGIGDARAKAIIDYREKNGPFTSLQEVAKVKGIGKSITEKNAELILFK